MFNLVQQSQNGFSMPMHSVSGYSQMQPMHGMMNNMGNMGSQFARALPSHSSVGFRYPQQSLQTQLPPENASTQGNDVPALRADQGVSRMELVVNSFIDRLSPMLEGIKDSILENTATQFTQNMSRFENQSDDGSSHLLDLTKFLDDKFGALLSEVSNGLGLRHEQEQNRMHEEIAQTSERMREIEENCDDIRLQVSTLQERIRIIICNEFANLKKELINFQELKKIEEEEEEDFAKYSKRKIDEASEKVESQVQTQLKRRSFRRKPPNRIPKRRSVMKYPLVVRNDVDIL